MGLAIGHEQRFRRTRAWRHQSGWHYFQWLLRTYVPDPSVVG